MPHVTDPVTILIAVQGNRLLRSAAPVDLGEFEKILRIGLSQDQADWATLRFQPANVRFDLWIDQLRADKADGILLADIHALGLISPPPGALDSAPLAVVRAFANVSFLQAGVLKNDELHLTAAQVAFPRRSLVTVADLVAFIDGRKQRADLREALLWQNANNLKFHEGDDWEGFVASITDERLDALFGAWTRTLSNMKFSDELREAWLKLQASKPNPRKMPTFVYHPERAVPRPPKADVAGRRLALKAELDAVRRVAEAKGALPWRDHFTACLAMLDAKPNAAHPMTKLLSPLAPEAIALVTTALSSDVFGGMGTWNDVPFAKDADYRAASDALHAAILPGITAAVNSIVG